MRVLLMWIKGKQTRLCLRLSVAAGIRRYGSAQHLDALKPRLKVITGVLRCPACDSIEGSRTPG